jgi:antitoxin VapB
MTNIAKVFMTGRSQAIRLPKEYRFKGSEVRIKRDPKTGDIILSEAGMTWEAVVSLIDAAKAPPEFMADREQGDHDRSPFEGYDRDA